MEIKEIIIENNEIISVLKEKASVDRLSAQLEKETVFRDDYNHNAQVLEKAAEIIRTI